MGSMEKKRIAEWWEDSRRDTLLGHDLRFGTKRAHITSIKDGGPGAVIVEALCGGIEGLIRCNSDLDLDNMDECIRWRDGNVRLPLWNDPSSWNFARLPWGGLCPRCVERYEANKLKALGQEAAA